MTEQRSTHADVEDLRNKFRRRAIAEIDRNVELANEWMAFSILCGLLAFAAVAYGISSGYDRTEFTVNLKVVCAAVVAVGSLCGSFICMLRDSHHQDITEMIFDMYDEMIGARGLKQLQELEEELNGLSSGIQTTKQEAKAAHG